MKSISQKQIEKQARKKAQEEKQRAKKKARVVEYALVHGKQKGRRNYRQCTPCEIPGEKVQIDVKCVPNWCIRGKHRKGNKKMYQWTAIDECTRMRFVYGYEEHTPENSVDFLKMFLKWCRK